MKEYDMVTLLVNLFYVIARYVQTDDVNKEVSPTSYKRQKLLAAYESLKKSGLNFTSYEER
jgi:hypothetical protein